MLPTEILSEVFLHLDPHTLYTSIRALDTHWRTAVETILIPHHFRYDEWKVGLRVTHRRRRAATLEQPSHIAGEGEDEDAVYQRLTSALATPGTLEDQLEGVLPPQVSHVIPLTFTGYDAQDTSLGFSTGSTWHALFEHLDEQDREERLDYDFAILWRFPGDGQDGDGWGEPDPENNWLSRFYCSNHDTSSSSSASASGAESPITLLSTPLARRTRQPLDADSNEARTCACQSTPITWSDAGNEYVSLSLSLGIEFFVRRSARANLLMRKLEAEARRADEEDAQQHLSAGQQLSVLADDEAPLQRLRSSNRSGRSTPTVDRSGRSTPNNSASPPPSRISGTAQRTRELTPLEQRLSRCFSNGSKAQPLTFGANTPSSRPGTPRSGRNSTPRRSRNPLLAAATRNSASGISTPVNGTAVTSALATSATSTPRGSNGRGTPRARFSARLLLGGDASSDAFRCAGKDAECSKCGLPRFDRGAGGKTIHEQRWRGQHAMGQSGAWLENDELAASITDAAGWKVSSPSEKKDHPELLDVWGSNASRQVSIGCGTQVSESSHTPEMISWQWSR